MNRSPLLFVLFLLVPFCFNGTQSALAQSPPVYTCTDLNFELAGEQGLPFSYQFPPDFFVDPNGDPMTYSVTDINSADASWLTINPVTKTLSGTPGPAEFGVGVFQLIITATDDEPQSANSLVIFLTILEPEGNEAPQENGGPGAIPNQEIDMDDPYAYTILQNVITDADGESFTLTYDLRINDGTLEGLPLPAWLTFESWRRELSGTPVLADVGTLNLRYWGFDQNGSGNYSDFQLTVHNPDALDITSVGGLADIPVPHATPFASIPFLSQVQVTLEDMSTRMINVSFPDPGYDPIIAGSHAIPGNLINLPGDVTNTGDLLATVNVVVAKGNQTITFAPDPLPAKTVADITTTFSLTSTSSSGLPVSYTSADPLVASVSGSTVTINGGGSTLITASQSGSSNYNPATNVSRTLTVARLSQTITFGSLSPVTFSPTGTLNLTATTSSGLPITYSSSDINIAEIVGGTVEFVHAGSVTITALQGGNTTYDPATPVDQILIINKGNQVITFGPLPGKHRLDPNFFLTASVDTGLPLTFSSSQPTVAIIGPAFNEVAIQGKGVTTISANQAGDADYNPASVGQPLTVGGQTITFGPLPNKPFNDPDFLLTASATSGLTVTYTSSNPLVATVSGSMVDIVGVGTTTITASQVGDVNYLAATPVDQPFTVTKLSQTITFGPIADKLSNGAPFTLSATATSGLTVSFASSNPAVATVSGTTVTITGLGTTTITASQAGDATYNAAANVPQPFNVISSTQSQTITFATIPDQTLGDSPYTLNAIASSGLPVVYSTTSDKVSLTGNQMVLFKSGRLNINANQPGSPSFSPATQVTRSFCIKPGKPFISGTQLNSPSAVLTSTASAGNQWFLNDVAIAGATGATINAQQPGVYTVQATTDDCVSAKSDNFPVMVTGDLYDPETAIKIYPNPAEDDLYVSWPETSGTSLVRIYQLDGKEIERLTTAEHELSIPVGHYAGGQYVLSIQTTKAHFKGRFLKK